MKSGDRLGSKYRLLRQLGAGAMGVVWEAIHETTQRRVAIKLLTKPSEDLRHRLLREARICGSIAHRNVIEIYDIGETHEGEPYLVMQLLSGETLAELLLRKRRLPQPLAAQIGRDIARALTAAHAVNVIHRDLKPANVFLHQEAGVEGLVVKVLDFGVAKNLAAVNESLVTAVGGAVGSPAYMSPEAIMAARDLDARTDVWSLGVVLFEVLTGTRPFPGGGQELVIRIATGKIPRVSEILRHVEPAFDDVVAMCLERDRAKRIASAAVVERLLQAYVGPNDASRIHVGLAERAMALPAPAAVIPEVPANLETTMPLPDNVPAPVAPAPILPMQPWTAAPAVDTTMPLSRSSAQAQPAGKAGTAILGPGPAKPATGPRGTALMIDARAVLAQAQRSAPPPSPPPPPSVQNVERSVARSSIAPASKKRRPSPILGLAVSALVAFGVGVAIILGLAR
ncbi:serine/threonine-protein kinase [Polyangium jinanense]|uniref:Protein kinase n=1 Tax=Polyangium jinanense TaxID=2829994 RepID=A0A9X3X9L1_9BACT|nr:serine/threonine-protein kinase [Polyangium jinanense]MDC3960485.1 protein kinase [Polyangium jinanense]MDC3986742.1 protein kinase [Polyangium jinanense]